MRNLSFFLYTLVVAVGAAACASSPTEPTGPSSPATIHLAPGQSVLTGSLVVSFVGVTSDTRCATDVVCVQAGDVSVAMRTSLTADDTRAFELQLLDATTRSTTHGVYSIELLNVTPEPVSTSTIAAGDYRVTFRVTWS